MTKRFLTVSSAVFFCTMSSVYSEWGLGVSGVNTAIAADSANSAGMFDKPSAPAPIETSDKAVKVGALGQIDLHVKDQDITKILQLLSIQGQRNIIVSRGVSGTVSADLYGVDFYQALDAILHSNGYGWREKGSFIYVYTAAELKQITDAERKPITHVMKMNYVTAADASTFVTPLLSSSGSITLSSAVSPGFQATISDGGANSFAHGDTLVIRDFPENIEEIKTVLSQLDVRPKQVLVEATVLEARLTERNALGVNLTILADFSLADFATGPGGVIGQVVNGTVKHPGQIVQWQNVVKTDDQSFRIGITDNENFAAFIDALDRVTDTTVLASPKLLVLNRQKAFLQVGDRKGYLSTTQTETTTTQTVQFLETGTKLTLRPFISDDGTVRLEVEPSISNGEVVQVGETSTVVPNETTERIVTNVLVKSGQTVILGGLFKEDTTVNRKQVPGIGDIPVLGSAFKGQSDEVLRNEYIFMLTPTVMKDQPLYAAGERAKDNIELARIGSREGLLVWSRSKMISSHIRDAREALAQGNKDKALFLTDLALMQDSTFVEARRLKEEIVGQRLYAPYDSSFQDAINHMIDQQPATTSQPTTQTPAPSTPTASTSTDATPASTSEPVVQASSNSETPAEPAVAVTAASTEASNHVTP